MLFLICSDELAVTINTKQVGQSILNKWENCINKWIDESQIIHETAKLHRTHQHRYNPYPNECRKS